MPRLQHRLRQTIGGVADAVLPGRFYAVFRLKSPEFVGTLDLDVADLPARFEEHAYSYCPVAAKKLHPETGQPDDGSYRRIDPVNSAKQWHVHVFDRPDGVEVFSHYELRPEPWRPLDLRRPVEHYWPEWGETCLLGQHCPELRALLEEWGSYEGDSDALGDARLTRLRDDDPATPAGSAAD